MSLCLTPQRRSGSAFVFSTPKDHSARVKFRPDGSLEPDVNPIKLTSPMKTPNRSSMLTEIELDRQLTLILTRFFSTLNSEKVFLRTLGKLAPETELDILGDTDGWDYLEGKRLSKERKLTLLNLYGVYDRKMQFVLKQTCACI